MSPPQPTIFFIDRCLGGRCIAEVLRSSGITVEIHDEHFDKGAQDVEWISEVGQRGWIVLTKDKRISKNHLERLAVASAGIKMFILASQGLSGSDMAEIFLKAIIAMQELVRKHPAPFMAKIYRDGSIRMWKDDQALLDELNQFGR
jgi:predicted nuclease of predicted toxin-antitoxin system